VADLSSNRPYHIELEKISRSTYTPLKESNSIQTRWFYERARGQYKNARLKEGFTKSRQKSFDLKNPKNQMFSKEELAKYINAYDEVVDGKKILIGPHFVVRGNQKNYIQFINCNLIKKLNNVYFEDAIAKAILFKAAEKAYGVKPNAIGDMRYVTVPYAISLLTNATSGQLDLYKIWRNQSISQSLKDLLYEMMKEIEAFIKSSAPGGLFGEWAKKEECWIKVKSNKFTFDFASIKSDLIDKKNPPKRPIVSDDETSLKRIQEETERIKSIPYSIWKKIEEYGYNTKVLTDLQCNIAFTIASRIRTNSKISDNERVVGGKVLDIMIDKVPELLFDADEELNYEKKPSEKDPEITLELIAKMVKWDKKNKKLKDFQFKLLHDITNGIVSLTPNNKKYCLISYNYIRKCGFEN
jgi:hypothetical protein